MTQASAFVFRRRMLQILVFVVLHMTVEAVPPKFKHEVLEGIYGLSLRYLLHEREIYVECGKPLTNITVATNGTLATNVSSNLAANVTANGASNATSKYDKTQEVGLLHLY